MPRDTNHYGTIFGGVILSYIDQAGFVAARRHAACKWVTAAIDRVEFKAPVLVGDVVNLYALTTRVGTTSVTVRIEVEAERNTDGTHVPVTAATLGFGLLSLGLIAGLIIITSNDGATRLGPGWWHSPKVLLSVAAWLLYALVLNVRHGTRFRGARAAWLSIAGLALLLTTLAIVTAMRRSDEPKSTSAPAAYSPTHALSHGGPL